MTLLQQNEPFAADTHSEQISPCPICGGEQGKKIEYLVPNADHEATFGDRHIAVCADCGFGNSLPAISGDDLGRYYASDFAPRFRAQIAKDQWPILDERSISQITIARLFADFASGDGFLDLGPGAGVSFFTASQLLPDPVLFGVEMNAEMIANLKRKMPQVRIVSALEEIPAVCDVPLKIILTSHCLEHFNGEEIVSTLRQIHELMEPDAILAVEVPHWDLRDFDKRRNDVPHLSFFSVDSLGRALRTAGFEIELLKTFGIPRGAPKDYEKQRRSKLDKQLTSGTVGQALLLANSPDVMPRDGGKVLRAVGRKN